jgi:hypothetical protein
MPLAEGLDIICVFLALISRTHLVHDSRTCMRSRKCAASSFKAVLRGTFHQVHAPKVGSCTVLEKT